MHARDISLILEQLDNASLVETHISWVLLTPTLAFKIKKPVKFPFVDFSSLARRKHFCLEEVRLNKRLAPDIYHGITEVRKSGNHLSLQSQNGEIVDYAVVMKRLPSDRQMHLLLELNQVKPEEIRTLAYQISAFHLSADKATRHPSSNRLLEDFADLANQTPFLTRHIPDSDRVIAQAIDVSSQVLKALESTIHHRQMQGFWIDGHGDLHSGNIFLVDPPVIFDCIEFSDHLRQVDILDEIAFFSIDLGLYDQKPLEKIFLETYLDRYPCLQSSEDALLYQYYKLYRTNVKLKVSCIKAVQSSGKKHDEGLVTVRQYYRLFEQHLWKLKELSTSGVSSADVI